jgi:hypothetical protein
MKKAVIISIIIIFLPVLAKAGTNSERLSGQILLNVEKNGEAWYIYPENLKRYYLGRPADAFAVMRELGLGITEADFQRLAQAGMPVKGDEALAKRLTGRIVLEVEKNGEAWYVYPKDLKKYYLGRPADAFRIMRELSLGVTREDLAKIHKPGSAESIDQYSRYEHTTVAAKSGEFVIDLVTIDLAKPFLRISTEVAEPYPSPSRDKNKDSFGAQSLAKYVLSENGFAGINGTYFCAGSGCGSANYYFYPVYDTKTGLLINESELKYWTTGPIMVFDENNKFYYFKDSREFKSVADFEKTFKAKIQAAIGNKPRLIEKGMNLLIDWDIDEKQKTAKLLRNALGYKDNKIYLAVARNATVPDLADIMQALGMEYAVNLDGGYSSALWYNDEYMVWPGRDIPNAIVFSTR